MNKKVFQYSLLQYKHSLTLNEAVNVGILFYFPEDLAIHFVPGALNRVKAIYDETDNAVLTHLLKVIDKKIKDQSDLFRAENFKPNLKKHIHSTVLNEDSTVLQFADPVIAVNTFKTYQQAIDEYTKLLLPGHNELITREKRHSESYLVKKLTKLLSKDKDVEQRLEKNKVIKTDKFELKFELGWQNGSYNLVKSISFDLSDEHAIQSKSAQYFGFLTLLNEHDYIETHNYKFDLLVLRPQNRNLFKAFDNALTILEKVDAPKEIITEDKIKTYSERILSELEG